MCLLPLWLVLVLVAYPNVRAALFRLYEAFFVFVLEFLKGALHV